MTSCIYRAEARAILKQLEELLKKSEYDYLANEHLKKATKNVRNFLEETK